MSEIRDVQEPVTEYARSKGWRARRMSYLGRHGCPDSWFFRRGQVRIIEFKDLGKPLKLHQKREIDRLRHSGMKVFVIDNVEAGYAVFDN